MISVIYGVLIFEWYLLADKSTPRPQLALALRERFQATAHPVKPMPARPGGGVGQERHAAGRAMEPASEVVHAVDPGFAAPGFAGVRLGFRFSGAVNEHSCRGRCYIVVVLGVHACGTCGRCPREGAGVDVAMA